VALLCWTCRQHAPSSTSAQLDSAPHESAAAANAARRSDPTNADSTRQASDSFKATVTAIALLDSEIARHPGDSSTPNRLFRLGKMKILALSWLEKSGGAKSSDDPYATAHDSDYFWDEPGGELLYSGRDWQRIVDHYSTSPVADSAGWAWAHLTRGGECEDDFWCYYDSGTERDFRFLEVFPGSSYASRAEQEIIGTLTTVLDSLPSEMKVAQDKGSVSATVDSMLAKFEGRVAHLAPPIRAALVPVSDSLRKHFGLRPARR